MIEWSSVIANLKGGSDVTDDPKRWNLENPNYTQIHDIWRKANFNANSIKWTNYYPEIHFPKDLVTQQANYLKINKVHRSWISRLDPGFMAPWHWDVDDNEGEYLKHGPITRYTLIIEKMCHGHILIIGDNYYFNQEKNTVIKWPNYREWHSGINAGMTPNYMFHILGS